MKKILFLMLIMGFFSPLINAYEYQVATNYNTRDWFYMDEHNGLLQIKSTNTNGGIVYNNLNTQTSRNLLALIRRDSNLTIKRSGLMELFKNDNKFLNDFYLQGTQVLLNYFYNFNSNWQISPINYENYELLYNSNGLVVESIVNGVWAGLYDNNEKNVSGRLYSKTGQILYINGKSVEHSNFFDIVSELFIVTVMECFGIASRGMVFLILLSSVLVLGCVIACTYWITGGFPYKSSPYIAVFSENGNRVSRWYRKESSNRVHGQNDHYLYGFRTQRDYMQWNKERDAEIERKRRIF